MRTLPETHYCAMAKHDGGVCGARLGVDMRCYEQHKPHHDGCCSHGFQFCIHGQCLAECSHGCLDSSLTAAVCEHGFWLCPHGKCNLDCGELECEPTLEHEYACTCERHGCTKEPCTGTCGCDGCRRAYIDAADGPD